jgi:SAM-dependent methyltransferase
MMDEVGKYFKHLALVREDIREELDKLGIRQSGIRICDFGCGTGLTTFGLAIEVERSICLGLDLFNEEIGVTPKSILNLVNRTSKKYYPEIFELIQNNRLPTFIEGNIVNNQNMPNRIDLAYCRKVLMNIHGKAYRGTQSGESGLLKGLRNIAESITSEGFLCDVEYDDAHILEKFFLEAGFTILRRAQIKRREVRSKGRTEALSTLTLYLCQKSA